MAQKPNPKRRKHIKKSAHFPKITKKNHSVKSDQSPQYNCIAFAADETNRKWWPILLPDAFWPAGVPYTETPDSFIAAFATLGYAVCTDDQYVEGVEKVALYTSGGRVKHAAKLIGPDRWASKLGQQEDIHHKKGAVAGGIYGEPTVYMSRPRLVAPLPSA